jgi:hypothetical protein
MKNERENMVAPCGIDCGICEMHTCKDNPEMMKTFIGRGVPVDKIPCKGCRAIDGNCPVIPSKCDTLICIQNKGLDFCYECNDFPCNMLHPCSDRANILPHNLKVFNLCTIKNKGVDGFIKVSQDIKAKYYKGKMSVGKGPQISNE